jgi:hypothetical protein
VSTTAHTSGDTTQGVPATPTRGYLTSVNSWDEVTTVTGWFHAIDNSNGIARRKVGGRNTYLFTTQGRVITFVADPTAK